MLADAAFTEYLDSRASRRRGAHFEFGGETYSTRAARRARDDLREFIAQAQVSLNPAIRGQTEPFQQALPSELANQLRQVYLSCRSDSATGGLFSVDRCDEARRANYDIRQIYNRASMGSGLQVVASTNALVLSACIQRALSEEALDDLMPRSGLRIGSTPTALELRSCITVNLAGTDGIATSTTVNGAAFSADAVIASQLSASCSSL
jgi:hypothetical protein